MDHTLRNTPLWNFKIVRAADRLSLFIILMYSGKSKFSYQINVNVLIYTYDIILKLKNIAVIYIKMLM